MKQDVHSFSEFLKKEYSAIEKSTPLHKRPASALRSIELDIPGVVRRGGVFKCDILDRPEIFIFVDKHPFLPKGIEYAIGRSSPAGSLHYLAGFHEEIPLYVRDSSEEKRSAALKHFGMNFSLLNASLPSTNEDFVISSNQLIINYRVLNETRVSDLCRFIRLNKNI